MQGSIQKFFQGPKKIFCPGGGSQHPLEPQKNLEIINFTDSRRGGLSPNGPPPPPT